MSVENTASTIKSSLLRTGAAISLASLIGCAASPNIFSIHSTPSSNVDTVVYALNNTGAAPRWVVPVAQYKGLLAKYHVAVTTVNDRNYIDSLISGQVNLAEAGANTAIQADINAHADLVEIGATSGPNGQVIATSTLDNKNIRVVANNGGPESEAVQHAKEVLVANGVNPSRFSSAGNDRIYFKSGITPQLALTMLSKDGSSNPDGNTVDAFVTTSYLLKSLSSEPSLSKIILDPRLRTLSDISNLSQYQLYGRRSYIQAHTDLLVRLSQALIEANRIIKEDREGAIQAMLSDSTTKGYSRDLIEGSYDSYNKGLESWSFAPDKRVADQMVDLLYKSSGVGGEFDTNNYIYNKIADILKSEGVI